MKPYNPAAKYPLTMSDDELRELLVGKPNTVVMRTLLVAEIDDINRGSPREQRTMRGMWYDYIKPCLSRSGLLNQKTKTNKDVPWAANLSIYLAELVREGAISYERLGIVDGSRQKRPACPATRSVQSIELVGCHYPWVILFSEKDTIWPVIENLASLYGVSAISGGGQPSAACTENVVKSIIETDAYQDAMPGKLVVIALTDYDPAGYTIAESQFAQVQDSHPAILRRIGITPDQLTPEERRAKSYEPKESGLDEWFEEYGGVDGKKLGLELDALPLSRLRALFTTEIEKHINIELRREDLRKAFIETLAWEQIKDEVNQMLTDAREAIANSDIPKRLKETAIPIELFRAAASLGWDSIDPTTAVYQGKPLFDCTDDAISIMQSALYEDDK
jgi:hypothetical protein